MQLHQFQLDFRTFLSPQEETCAYQLSPAQPLATTDLLSLSVDVPVLGIHIHGMTRHAAFCVWLLAVSVMVSRSVHTVMGVRALFLFMAESYSIVWMDHVVFIRSQLIDGHLGYFCFLVIVISAAVNIYVQGLV